MRRHHEILEEHNNVNHEIFEAGNWLPRRKTLIIKLKKEPLQGKV